MHLGGPRGCSCARRRVTFDCGADPVVIALDETAKVFNNTGPEIVVDGGGLVTLSGGGERRILYMNTCDEDQIWTIAKCDNQDHPRLTIQNITLVVVLGIQRSSKSAVTRIHLVAVRKLW